MSGAGSGRLGRWGEALAADYLTERGYLIVERNYHSPYGEIDLIARKGGYLAFVEVKLRKGDSFAPARAFVDPRKRRRIEKTALCYLAEQGMEGQPRFDVMEIYAPQGVRTERPQINYLENAFLFEGGSYGDFHF